MMRHRWLLIFAILCAGCCHARHGGLLEPVAPPCQGVGVVDDPVARIVALVAGQDGVTVVLRGVSTASVATGGIWNCELVSSNAGCLAIEPAASPEVPPEWLDQVPQGWSVYLSWPPRADVPVLQSCEVNVAFTLAWPHRVFDGSGDRLFDCRPSVVLEHSVGAIEVPADVPGFLIRR